MSCGNIKLVGYANLNNVIIKEHGINNPDYNSLIAMIEDPIFKKIVADKNINVKTSGRQAYNALLEARAIKLRNIEDAATIVEKEERGLFSTIKARNTAITYVGDIMNKLNFNFLYSGAPLSYNEIRKRANKTIVEAGIRRAKKLANNKAKLNELNAFINNNNPAIQINGIGAFIRKYGDSKDFNFGALLRSLTNKEFNDRLLNNKNIAKLINRDELYQTTDYNELGGYIDETSIEGDENDLDSGVDVSTQLWNLSIGELNDFNKHVDEIIKSHLASLPKLTTAGRLDNGMYSFDTNNELGVVTFVDPNYLSKILYSSADTSNVDNFIASLKRIAETIPNCECLIQLYDLLNNNKVFANKYMMVFNKPIISKIETYIQSDANGNSYVRSRITNPNTNTRTILENTFYNNVKNNIITNRVPLAREKYKLYQTYKNSPNADIYLYDVFKVLFPDINQSSFRLALNKIGNIAMANNIISFANVINNTVDNYNKYKEALKINKNTKMPDSFINKGDTSIIYQMANVFQDIIYIPIELNSHNPEGNVSSDIINRSFITNIDKIINDDKISIEQQNAMIEAYAEQKFASRQYDYSNFLVEHTDENGNIINYGLFRLVDGAKPKLTEYARSMFNTYLLNGISNLDNNNNDLYRSMSDGDYTITALGLFMSNINNSEIAIANYLLPIPSDAPKNFTITAPRYSINGLRTTLEDGTKIVNRDHLLFKQYYNIAIQELTNMGQAINVMFKTNADGLPVFVDGEFEFSETYNNNPNHFYDQYHKDSKGKVFVTKDAHKVLAGRIFSFKRLISKVTPNSNGLFNELLGYGKPIDILYGGSTRGLKYINDRVVLNTEQTLAIEEAVATWLNDYITNGYLELKNKYGTFIQDSVNNETIAEFLINDYLVRDSMYDLYGGDQSFYKNSQAILKRIKEVQASGNPFGNTDFTKNDLNVPTNLYDVTINGNVITVPYTSYDGTVKRKKVTLQDKFRGVTIYNTSKSSTKDVIDRLDKQLKKANINKNDRARILSPFHKNINANDAQSYITLEEWIRRITAAGELEKYKGLITSLTDNTPVDEIDWNKFANKVQIQKNFYYDLYYDAVAGIEVPRQVKNAEFVLIPKLLKGTELEKVYNIMTERGIHQLNTVETVKVAQHNRMTLWDNDGVLTEENLNNFDNNCFDNSELFSYNYLYRQQEVPQHMVDASNKAAIQIMKKILDNLPNTPELDGLKKTMFNNYVANIRNSFEKTCAELGIDINENGHIELSDNNTIKNLNRYVFFDRFKENAQRQNVDESLLEFFDLDAAGFNNLPLFLSNINSKIESIANSYFNTNITRQLISGWHAAQLSDFGFKVDGQTQTDSKLQYKKLGDIDGTPVYYTEIKLPRWSRKLNKLNIKQVPDNLRTMIGYRIPTEGKQSICIMYVKEFLPDAYGSTVVVPDEWVTQTGSDFDVDSVYGMSKTFNLVNDVPTEITHARYTKDRIGYINYVRDNVDKVSRKIIGKNYNAQGYLKFSIKNSEDAINASLDGYNGNLGIVEKIAKEGGLLSYDSYVSSPVEDSSSQAARTNAIIQSFIDILNNPASYEENTTTSNFDNITDVNKEYSEIVGSNKTIVAPSDFFTQLDWFDAATSGIKLKGISVNRDTFMSISNVVKSTHETGIKVLYSTDHISEREAIKRYGKENVESIENTYIRITHKNFGWSNDNKNIEGYLINPYSSQTTAHILDVMKEGAIHNENTYTFNAFKTIVDFGSNYDTAIGFLRQPAIDILVRKWKESNSVLIDDNKNPLTEAIREVAHNLKFGKKVDFANRASIITIISESYGERFKKLFNMSVSDAFSSSDLIFSSDAYKNRLRGELNGIDGHLFDLYVLAQFKYLDSIGNDISSNLSILTADKYGAKQSFYATEKVFRDASGVIDNSRIYAPSSSTGGQTLLLESIFPDISGGINAFIKSDISRSSYPSLAAFLQMSTAFSVKATQEVFETANPVFVDYVYKISEWTRSGRMNEKLYNDYKNYLINKLEVGNNASPYLVLPVTVVNGEFVNPKDIKEVGTGIAKSLETGRVSGTLINIDVNSVTVNNIFEPTQNEIDNFAKLTPAQKMIWIKNNFNIEDSIFEHVEVIANDERNNRNNFNIQYINYIQGDIVNDEAHKLFDRAWNHPNPLIKLAAIDLVKYAFIVENHRFRTKNISRLLSNTPLRGLSDNGISIGELAMKGINSYGFISQTNDEDIIGFIRKNYNTFDCPNYKLSTLNKNGVKTDILKTGVIAVSGELENAGLIKGDDLVKVIRINKTLYIGGRYNSQYAFYPINKLETFETYNGLEPSIITNNNSYQPLSVLVYEGLTSQEKRDRFIDSIKSNIIEADSKNYKEIDEKYAKYISNYYIQPFMNTPFEHNTIYIVRDKLFLNINGETAINLDKDLKERKEQYPNIDNNKLGVFIEIEPEEIDRVVTNNPDYYSSINDQTPIGRFAKNTSMIIARAVRHGQPAAQNVLNALNNAEINYLDSNSLNDNSEFSLSVIANYIDVEANNILNSINRFIKINGIDKSINDPEVIGMVLKDEQLQNRFLDVILSANTFKNKYKLINDIDTTSNLDDKVKENIEKIQKLVNQVDANTIVRSARKEWFERWMALHTTNPNYLNGLMKEFDAYGDTGFMDYWIQDIRANRNFVLQNILKDVMQTIEEGRLNGIMEHNEFSKYLSDLKARANRDGKNVSFNNIVDEEGRLIQTNNEEWSIKLNKYRDVAIEAEQKYGANSVEHLIALSNKAKFIDMTTIHQLLPITVQDENGDDVAVNYSTYVIDLERRLLGLKVGDNGIPKEFAEYKKLNAKIRDILSQATDNITTEEQDEELGRIYAEMDNLTSLYDEEDNKKIGHDLEVAEKLRAYIKNIRIVKEYFYNKEAKEGFDSKLKEQLAIISKYESQRDANNNLIVNMAELMKIPEYRNAKNWIRKNTRYVLDVKDSEDLNWAFEELKDANKGDSVLNIAIREFQARDEFNVVDGRKIPEERVALIKKEAIRKYKYTKGNGLPYAGIIRSADEELRVYRPDFYSYLTGNKYKSEEEIAVGEAINKILERYFDTSTRTLNTSDASFEDLEKLKTGFEIFNELSRGTKDKSRGRAIAEFIESECDVTYNWERYELDKHRAWAKGKKYYDAWMSVFSEEHTDENNTYSVVPNRTIYGVIKPKNLDMWTDIDKTTAINILQKRTRETTTQYYFMKEAEVRDQYGIDSVEYKQWYNDNHYYDPYTRTIKPIRIWTTMQMVKDDGTAVAGDFEPRINQMHITPKKELINPNYSKYVNKYALGSGYDNSAYTSLNSYELELMDTVKDLMKKYAFTSSNERYIDMGYLPALPKVKEMTAKDYAEQALGFLGWTVNIPNNTNWRNNEDLTFDKDYDIPNPRLTQLGNKETQQVPTIPRFKEPDESDADFAKRKAEAIKVRDEIIEKNNKIHSDIINRNWEEVFKSFIVESSRYNAIKTVKNLLYTADQIIADNTAYDINYKGSITENRESSAGGEIEYKQEKQTRTSEHLRSFIRRLVFEQYKNNKTPNLVKLGSLAQNIAGSKYMMLNITGGIANVLTGSSNIFMERAAAEYINLKDWEYGKSEWVKGAVSYMTNMYSENSTTVQDAIIKLSKVVDFDRITEISNSEGLRENIRRFRGLLFSPQSVGEHYMQNVMLFAMLKSHRIVPNNRGGYSIMSKEMYRRKIEEDALLAVINGDNELLNQYNQFMDDAKADDKKRAKYNLYKENPIFNFVRTYLNNDQQRDYINKRKEFKKEADKKFAEHSDVYSQFELKDGIANIKSDSKLTLREYAGFIDKVREVNKKVHGVYDKLGSANLEQFWFGGMLMQYHKHLYPGFKKRYRWNGYYNETLGTIEKGSYTSLYDYLTIPFKDTNVGEINNVGDVLKAFQTYGKNVLSFAVNFKLNYELLPEHEKANMRRNLGDILYVGAAIIGAIAITGLGGDDDEGIMYNLMLYHADRLASEAASFTPFGAYAEGKKLWSSPVAIQQTINDLLGTTSMAARMLLEEDFVTEYTTGRYKGLNKFEVFAIRNTPVVRSINRVMELPDNNSYYKLDENILSIIPYKDIAKNIFE